VGELDVHFIKQGTLAVAKRYIGNVEHGP
jgi:hypothetical protein